MSRRHLSRYACQRCGRADGLDAVVPSDIWAQMLEVTGCNILCLWCMDAVAESINVRTSCSLHFEGNNLTGTSQSDADKDHVNRLVEQREQAQATAREALELLGEWAEKQHACCLCEPEVPGGQPSVTDPEQCDCVLCRTRALIKRGEQ